MKRYQKSELKELIDNLLEVFDDVRIVDPKKTSVFVLDDNELINKDKNPCFSIWDKEERCSNCISLLACTNKQRTTKFEFKNESIYSVTAIPLIIEDNGIDKIYSLEMISKLDNEMFINAEGTGFITELAKITNKKIYEDSLTGVYNRRFFDDNLFVYQMATVLPKKIGFMVIDIKKFKSINDTYGHYVGDEALKQVAMVIKNSIRKTDMVLRFGGDEFVVILRDCEKSFIFEKEKQIKDKICNLHIGDNDNLMFSVNIGISYTDSFSGSKKQISELFKQADKNMYEDKKKG